MSSNEDHPRVIAYPPFIYLSFCVSALLFNVAMPAIIFRHPLLWLLGLSTIGSGIGVVLLAFRELERGGTNIDPYLPVVKIVREGPYRFTRNPIYLGLALIFVGIGFLINNLWFMAFLIPLLIVVEVGVVRREERYLKEKFGEEYSRYLKEVRRWI